jgi:DNA invertase Pin-like site-specific DNA recombinase
MELSKLYAAQHNLELDSTLELTDIGVSAFRGKQRTRGTLSLFLKHVESRKVSSGSYLLVESIDRLSREEVLVALRLFLSIIDAGITIVTLADQQVFSKESVGDGMKLIMSIVIMARAHEESLQKSRRLAAAWKNKRDQAKDGGKKLTARAPAWLRISSDRTKFVVLKDRVTIVERIFRETIDGLGAMTLARRLNADGVKPFGRSSAWHISSIKKILNSECAFGRFQPHTLQAGKRIPVGTPIDDYYPVVVSEPTFWKARYAIDCRKTRGAGRKGVKLTNLFSGFTYCVACGSRMSVVDKGKPPKGATYLQCYAARRHAGCPNKQLFRLDQFETGMFHLLAMTPLSHPFNRAAQEQTSIMARGDEIDGRIGAIQKQLDRLAKLLGDIEQDFDDALGEQVQQLRREKERLRAERKQLNRKQLTITAMDAGGSDVHERLNRYQAHLASLNDPDEIYRERALMAQHLRRLIKRVDFYGNGATVKFLDESEEGTVHLNDNVSRADVPMLVFERAGSEESMSNSLI